MVVMIVSLYNICDGLTEIRKNTAKRGAKSAINHLCVITWRHETSELASREFILSGLPGLCCEINVWYNINMKQKLNSALARVSLIAVDVYVLLITIVLSLGVLIANFTSDNSHWLSWSFSALGERGTFSAFIFNSSVALAAVLMWLMSHSLRSQLTKLQQLPAALWSNIAVRAMAFCLLAVACFPNDTQHELHLIFSRLIVVIFGLYTLSTPPAFATLSQKQRSQLYMLSLTAVMMCITGYLKDSVSFVIFESISAASSFAWLYLFGRFIQYQTVALPPEKGLSPAQKKSV